MGKITDQYSDAMGDIGGRQPDLYMYSFAPVGASAEIVGVYLDAHGAQASALETYNVTTACTLLSLAGAFPAGAVGFRGVTVGAVYRGWSGQSDGTVPAGETPGAGYEVLGDGTPLFLGRVNANQGGYAVTLSGSPSVTVANTTAAPVAVASAKNIDTIVRSTPGKLLRVLVTATTANAGAMQIFDNAASGTGTIIGTLPQNAALGTTFDFEMPASAGITVKGDVNNPGVTISHSS